MQWNVELYQSKHLFVAKYGESLLSLVDRGRGQTILDLGCGTGELTKELAAEGARVLGIDSSPAMIERARADNPQLEFLVADAGEIPYRDYFDTVFSNAVFHWIADQKKLLASVARALKKGGVLVCEFGGAGNIAAIQDAFCRRLEQRGAAYRSPFFFPSATEYKALLGEAGLTVRHLLEYDRPTPLNDGEAGLRNWVTQFFAEDLSRLPAEDRQRLLCEMEEELRPLLWEGQGGRWIADYRRLQLAAVKD